MSPYTARAELASLPHDWTQALRLRLDPISAEVRVPIDALSRTRIEATDVWVDRARSMVRQVRALASKALLSAIFNAAPPGFDWEAFERDEIAQLELDKAKLTARCDRQDRIIRQAQTVFEATGMSWGAVIEATRT